MADIAVVFHWSPETMNPMEIEELADWRDKAITRLKAIHKRE